MNTETAKRAHGAVVQALQPSQDVTGLMEGTIVLTLEGEMPVEHLSPGDRIITREGGMAFLRELRATELGIAPIEVKAGSLGHTRPDKDTMVAPGARIHIRDWRAQAMFGTDSAKIPARRLSDGEFIAEGAKRQVTVYDLVFDHPYVVYADGLEIVSTAA